MLLQLLAQTLFPLRAVSLIENRLMFAGSNHLYIFMNPKNTDTGGEDLPQEITWEFAQKEIAQVKGFATTSGAGLTKGRCVFRG